MKKMIIVIAAICLVGCTKEESIDDKLLDMLVESKMEMLKERQRYDELKVEALKVARGAQQYQALLNKLYACKDMNEIDAAFIQIGMKRDIPEVGLEKTDEDKR